MGGIKMNLAGKLKEAKHESFDKWFERWYKEQDLEKQLIVAASQGNSEFRIGIQEDYERVSKFSDRKVYLNRRLRDDRTVEKISNELGEGIKVEYKENNIRSTGYFGTTNHYYSDWIEISW